MQMNRYKIYLATDIEVTAFSAEQARQKALCGFMAGIAQATDDVPLRVLNVTMIHIPERSAPQKQKKKTMFGGLL